MQRNNGFCCFDDSINNWWPLSSLKRYHSLLIGNMKITNLNNTHTLDLSQIIFWISSSANRHCKILVPVLHHYIIVLSGPQGSCSVQECCSHLKKEFRSCTRERQWSGIIHYLWWTASIKPRLLFSRAGYASWGRSHSLVYYQQRHSPFNISSVI